MQCHKFRSVLDEMSDIADKTRRASEGVEFTIDEDLDFECGLGRAIYWRADGAEAIGTTLTEFGPVEGIVGDADIVGNTEAGDVIEGAFGIDVAGGARDDDAQGACHAQAIYSSGTRDRLAVLDPGIGSFEIENWPLRWTLVRRGVERRGEASHRFPEVERDADHGTASIRHNQSIANLEFFTAYKKEKRAREAD